MANASNREFSNVSEAAHFEGDSLDTLNHVDYDVRDCWLCVAAVTDNHYMYATGDELNHTTRDADMCQTCADEVDELAERWEMDAFAERTGRGEGAGVWHMG